MKFCSYPKFAFLFLLLGAISSRVISSKNKAVKIEQALKQLVQELQSSQKPSAKQPRARKLKMEASSDISVPTEVPQAHTRIYTQEELTQKLEEYGHNAWESANDLSALVEASKQNLKDEAPTKTTITGDEESKIKEAILFVREANTALKYYIDHFVLTEEVLKKYEEYIDSHPSAASSTNGILKFMIHEFRGITLRKYERDFFDKVKMYNSVIKERFTPLFFLPISNQSVHTLQIKLLNGQTL